MEGRLNLKIFMLISIISIYFAYCVNQQSPTYAASTAYMSKSAAVCTG